ncbi:MAG TPA: shikimate kinase, partial [Methylomirabilota bacterium]|nr:shikimate kinase [Methylomirabilota bacterium]
MAGNIILVGFMGAGKSTVGRLLAKRLNRCFVETDDMVVAKAGKPIRAIFAEDGEAQFRGL